MRISMRQLFDHLKSKNNPHKVRRGQIGEPYKTIVTETSAYTVTTDDEVIIADATGGAFAVTLLAASGRAGRVFWIKKSDSSANAVTVTAAGSDKIDGAATYALSAQYDSIGIISDGTNWQIITTVP